MWGGGGGGGAQQLQCKSESAQCTEKQQSPCEEDGRGLKFEKIYAGKTIKSAPKEKLGIGSPLFCTFSFTPNTITMAQHGSSLGTGALFVTTRLHGICNGSNKGMENGGGGWWHTLQTRSRLRYAARQPAHVIMM